MKRGTASARRIGALPPMSGDPRAVCRAHDGDLFYPERYDSAQADQARAVCHGCPLRELCLTWAIDNETHGIWAGLSPIERAMIDKVEVAA